MWLLWGSDFKLSTIRPRNRLSQALKSGAMTNSRKVGPSPIPLLPAATIAPRKEQNFLPLVDSEDRENVPVRLNASNIPAHTLGQIKTLEKSLGLFGTSSVMPAVKKNLFRCPVEQCISVEDPKRSQNQKLLLKTSLISINLVVKWIKTRAMGSVSIQLTVRRQDDRRSAAVWPRNQEHCRYRKYYKNMSQEAPNVDFALPAKTRNLCTGLCAYASVALGNFEKATFIAAKPDSCDGSISRTHCTTQTN